MDASSGALVPEAAMSRSIAAVLILVFGGAYLAGCSSNAASPNRAEPLATPVPRPSKNPERAAKPAARELAFSTYSNPEYGVSFHYPRNFALEEGAGEQRAGIRSQEELEREEPGGLLVATVAVPDDAYPNTAFAGGSLQFAVNRYLTARSCRASLLSRRGDANGRSGAATIQSVEFAWADNDEGDGGTEFFERDYAGFANGACYEFFLRVGVAADTDGERPPDEKKILGHLGKIVSSLQFQSKSVSVLDGSILGEINRPSR
jgi:hypothetical protein